MTGAGNPGERISVRTYGTARMPATRDERGIIVRRLSRVLASLIVLPLGDWGGGGMTGSASSLVVAHNDPPPIAITGATVIDGTGAPPQRNTTILVRDGR